MRPGASDFPRAARQEALAHVLEVPVPRAVAGCQVGNLKAMLMYSRCEMKKQ